MGEKKEVKVTVASLFLALELIIIVVMGVVICKLYSVNTTMSKTMEELNLNLNEKVADEEESLNEEVNEVSNEVSNEVDNDKDSFEELMSKLYPQSEQTIDDITYMLRINEKEFSCSTDMNGGIEEFESSQLFLSEGKLYLNVRYPAANKKAPTSVEITGVKGEIVDVVLNTFEVEAKPEEIVILTRDGNVYLVNEFEGDIKAKKVDKLSKIIKIDLMDTTSSDAFHVVKTPVAIDMDGNIKNILLYK